MTPRSQLKQVMKKAIRDLKIHNALDSPAFYIKSKHPGTPKTTYIPAIEDPDQSLEEMGLRLKKLCEVLDAEEVITFAQVVMKATDKKPEIPILVARLERKDNVFIMYQPYTYFEAENKFHFQNPIWKSISKDGSTGSFDLDIPIYV